MEVSAALQNALQVEGRSNCDLTRSSNRVSPVSKQRARLTTADLSLSKTLIEQETSRVGW